MNLLFDLGHPAHFHLFKNLFIQLKENGHQLKITAKKKDILLELLNESGLEYSLIEKGKNAIIKHINGLISLNKIYKKNKIDIAIGVSVIVPQAALGNSVKSIVFDDDDISATPIFAYLSHAFANQVVSPSTLASERNRKKDIFHHSFHELAYLHPNQFKADDQILKELGIDKEEFFSIIRFSALKAHHDKGEIGIDGKQAHILIQLLEKKGRVFITSEKELPTQFEKYRLKIAPNKFHDLLSFSGLLVCDSQTVASEAAVLGIPSVRVNSFVGRISYLEELEHQYQLTFGFKPDYFNQALEKIETLITLKNSKEIFQTRRQKLLSEKIDLTAFMLWFIENYPKSVSIMKENPDYQYSFK